MAEEAGLKVARSPMTRHPFIMGVLAFFLALRAQASH